MEQLKLTQIYEVGKKAEEPRFFLQHLICEQAGWEYGEELHVLADEKQQEIIIQSEPFTGIDEVNTIHVSQRKNTGRPILDTAGKKYKRIVDVKQKCEVLVYDKKVVIRPLHFNLMAETTVTTNKDQRLNLLSVCAGAGIGTSIFKNTGYYSPVMEIEFEEDSSEVLKHNFPTSYLFNGDMRDCQTVVKSDVAFISMPCNESSSLGFGDEGVFNNLVIAAAKIIQSSKAKALVFENVPQWYKSKSYQNLKELLFEDYPYWSEKNIEAADFGSLATRNRTYAVAFQDEELFSAFEFPTPPANKRRKKLYNYLESWKEDSYEWKPLDKWMESFNSREAWKDRNLDKTFVTTDAKEINCIAKRYRSHSASNSYVLNKARDMWRFLTELEVKRILSIPEWFEFPEHIGIIRRFEMLGQSVDGRVVGAIANNLATAFYKAKNALFKTKKKVVNEFKAAVNVADNGQLSLII